MSLLEAPKKWDGYADVLVVGAGNAGLPAAITATDKGAKVIVLEAWGSPASSLAYIAGGTPFVGTDLQKEKGVEDSPDECFLKEAVEVSGGSPELYGVIAGRQLETYEWLKGLGAKALMVTLAPGHKKPRIHRWEGGGGAVLKTLRRAADKRGIQILFKHRAERLITDPETGRVIGIKARHGDKVLYFRAKKAVILATGGFARNKELVAEYGPLYVECIPVTPPTHMGDGLKMALYIGAGTANIGSAVCPSISVCTETKRSTVLPVHGAIAVNKDGRRWTDERGTAAGTYSVMFRDIVRQDPHGGLHFLIYDEKIRRDAPPHQYQHIKEYKADTIEGLANAVGLAPEALVETINEYNSDIDEHGYDVKFGRREWGGIHNDEPPPKIDTPPYYIVRCKVSLSSLKGGLKINAKAQVMDQFDEVIPGLYAAGEVAGGFFGKADSYYTGFMTLQSFVFGRVAGENAAGEVSN